jgi:hypothetical protein
MARNPIGATSFYRCPNCGTRLTFSADNPAPATDAAGGIHLLTAECPTCRGLFGRRYGEAVPVTPISA